MKCCVGEGHSSSLSEEKSFLLWRLHVGEREELTLPELNKKKSLFLSVVFLSFHLPASEICCCSDVLKLEQQIVYLYYCQEANRNNIVQD